MGSVLENRVVCEEATDDVQTPIPLTQGAKG